MLEQDTKARQEPPKPEAPLRQLGGGLYRLLPALAIGVAMIAILVTVGQALLGRAPSQAAPKLSPTPAAPALAADTAAPARAQSDTPTPRPTASATMAAVATATPRPPTATPVPPTATPEPPASMQLSMVAPSRIRAEGSVLVPKADEDYWFLIREPDRTGVFRQGPALLNASGEFVYDLNLQPLSTGPDSVTLAAIPKGLSLAWTHQALSTGQWLPVVDVRAENGIAFLREVGL